MTRMEPAPEFGVSAWSCVFDKRRGTTRALNVWFDGHGARKGPEREKPDITVYLSAAGNVRVYRAKSGKTTRIK